MDIYFMRSWTHHEPKKPKGAPGVLQAGFKPPKGQAAVMLHLGNVPVEQDIDAAWVKQQIESLGFIHHLEVEPLRAALEAVANHAPPDDDLSDPQGGRWVGDSAMLQVHRALGRLDETPTGGF